MRIDRQVSPPCAQASQPILKALPVHLRLAQELRDARVGGPILEARRPGGEFSRFDRRRGYFGAYNPDGTIRTFFIPNNGERYFRRQAQRRYD